MSEYLINGNIYFVVLLKKGFFSEFPSEHTHHYSLTAMMSNQQVAKSI